MALIDNILGYWKLDESSGLLYDSTDGNNDLTNSGADYSQTGIIGTAMGFDGTDKMTYDSPNWDIGTGNYTVTAWVNATSWTGTYACAIIALGIYSPSWLVGSAFLSQGYMGIYADDAFKTFSTSQVPTGEYVFIAWVRRGTGSGETDYYINGSYVSSTTHNGSVADGILCFGDDNAGLGNTHRGTIDEVGIWNRALGSTEITALYNGGAGLSYPFGTENVGRLLANIQVK